MYDTPLAALRDLDDDLRLERVALHVLRARHPELRITSPVGDLGRDGYGRPLFGEKDDTVLLVSLEQRWTSKLSRELDGIERQPPADQPDKAIFATTQSTKQMHHTRFKERAKGFDVALEIVDLNELSLELETPPLRWVAECELGVRPQAPAVLVPAADYLAQMAKTVPGADFPLHGRDAKIADVTSFASGAGLPGTRLLVVEGPGGIGKSRAAVESAWAAGPTLVARTAVALPRDAVTDLPRGEAVTLVVDDAHRAPDLSGVAALVGDSRYDHVRMILTIRTGFADRTLDRAGLAHLSRETVTLEPLGRADVDAIVRDHGIDDDEFALAVIELSEGVPLVAHAAAAQASEQGRFGWQDAGSVLETFAASRLLGDADRGLRAAAVALSLLTSASGGDDLAVLAGAVTTLPADEATLDGLLADLADAGLADAARGPGGDVQYTIRPHPVGTVLVAAALTGTGAHGVRVRVDRTLTALNLAPPDGFSSIRLAPSLLAARLDVLAGAALRGDDTSTARALGHVVLSLVRGGTDADGWTEALTMAQQVAPAAPWLFEDLRDELVQQWPPPVEGDLWPLLGREGPAWAYAQIALAIGRVASTASEAAATDATRLLLDAVTLTSPYLDARDHEQVLLAVKQFTVPAGAFTAERVAGRRRVLLGAIDQWITRRLFNAPGATLDPPGARTALAAVRPFLSPAVESARRGTAEGADVYVMRSGALPAEHPDVQDVLSAARSQAVTVIVAAPVEDPCAKGTTSAIVELAADLYSESRIGLPLGGGPLPPAAASELALTAAAVSEAVASVWNRLPLWARHRAAASATQRLQRAGDPPAWTRPIEQQRAADEELALVSVVIPIDEDLEAFDHDKAQWERTQEALQASATILGADLPWRQGCDLLEQVADIPDGLLGGEVRAAFARAVGRAMPEGAVGEALGRLAARAVSSDPQVVEGLLTAHPDAASRELVRLTREGEAFALALPVVWRLPEDHQREVLDAAHRVAAGSPTGAVGSTAATPTAEHDNSALQATELLAMALFRGDHDPQNRMRRLAALGMECPVAALPQVLRFGAYLLRRPQAAADRGVDAPAEAESLVAVLERFAQAMRMVSPNRLDGHHGIAQTVASLAVAHPAATATALAGLLLDSDDASGRWPLAWKEALTALDPAERGRFGDELARAVEVGRVGVDLPDWRAFEIEQTLAGVRAGTHGSATTLRAWARGDDRQRARAVAAISASWRQAEWPEIVSELLHAGITSRQRRHLVDAIEPTSFGPDVAERAEERYAVLERLSPLDHPDIASFRTDATAAIKATVDDYVDGARRRAQGY